MALLGHRGLLTRLRSLKRGRFVCYSCAMHRVSGRRKRSSVRLSVGQAAGGGPPPPLTQSRLPVPSSRLSTVAVPQSKFSAARRTTGTFGSSTGVRTSSIMPFSGRPSSVSSKGPVKDPRALSDKGVQAQMIKKLQKFLRDSEYSFALSRSDLQTPSTKVFSSLFQYVYGFIDPTCKLTGKVDEEVPALLKRLGYPYMISKKALSSVGSVHTWPQLLGSFSFLIDIIQLSFTLGDDLFSADDFGCLDEQRPADFEAEFDKVSSYYSQFMSKQMELGELKAVVNEEIDHQYREEEAALCSVKEEIRQLNAQIEIEEKQYPSLEAVKSRHCTLQQDRDNFLQFVCDMKSRVQFYKTHVEEADHQLQKKESEVADTQKICDQLQETVMQQPISKEEMAALKEEHGRLLSNDRKDKETCHVYQQESQLCDMQYSKILSKCEKSLERYKANCRGVQLIPTDDFEIKLDLCAGSASHNRKVLQNMKRRLMPKIETAIEEDDQQLQNLQQSHLTTRSEYGKVEAAVTERANAVARIKTDCEHVEKEVEHLEKVTAEDIQKAQGAYSTWLSTLQQLRLDDGSDLLEEKKRHLKLLQKKAEDEKERIMKEQNEYLAHYRSFLELCKEEMLKIEKHEERLAELLVSGCEAMNSSPWVTEFLRGLQDE